MKTLNQITEDLEGHELIMREILHLTNTRCDHLRRDYNFIFWALIIFYLIMGIWTIATNIQLGQTRKQLDELQHRVEYMDDYLADVPGELNNIWCTIDDHYCIDAYE